MLHVLLLTYTVQPADGAALIVYYLNKTDCTNYELHKKKTAKSNLPSDSAFVAEVSLSIFTLITLT